MQTASTQKGLIVTPQITLKVSTSERHIMVDVTWKNTSATDTYLFDPWQLFQDNMMEGSLLQITQDGRKVDFLGPMVKRKASEEKDLISLGPGRSLAGRQDITQQYEFASGTHVYSVVYAAFVRVSTPDKYIEIRSEPALFTATQ